MKIKHFVKVIFFIIGVQISVYAQSGDGEPAARTTDYNNIQMPESPTSGSLGKIDELTVNTATGVPSINIPLYTFEMDGVSVPISISYNASGIKVGDLATSVGLNWSLEAGGQISRTVRGKADDFSGWFDADYTFLSDTFFSSYDPNDPLPWQRAMKGNYDIGIEGKAKLHDHMPDQFNYSFLGHSGSFLHNPNGNVIKEKTDGLNILDWEKMEDFHGNTYEFENFVERSNNKNTYAVNADLTSDFYDWEQQDGNTPITAWKLSKITTKNGKEVLFNYESIDFDYLVPRSESNLSIGYSCSNSPRQPVENYGYTRTEYFFNTQLIKKISSPNGNIEVIFTYETVQNAPNGVWATQLNEITIKDKTDNQNPRVKGFRFVYGHYNGDPRLRLDELYEFWVDDDGQDVVKPSYYFTYKGGSLESKDSFKQDFFGYHNNSSGDNSFLVPTIDGVPQGFQSFFDNHSRNRSLNTNYVDIGILEEIEYPTGGKIKFTYEPNSEVHPNSNIDKYVGGLRVKTIEKIDRSETISRKTYQYSKLKGFSMEHNISLFHKKEGADVDAYYSNFVSVPGNEVDNYKPGYFYEKVTIVSSDSDPDKNVTYKEEHIYEENTNALHKFDYALKEKKYFKQNSLDPIKIEEYTNSIIGTATDFSWNTLGDMMCYTYNSTYDISLGHNNLPTKINYIGDYAFLPTQIVSTEFLGAGRKPVTTVKKITYDPETLLKTQSITDTRYTRQADGSLMEDHPSGEVITTTYQYSWSQGINLPHLPGGLPISKVVHSNKHENNDEISGQYFEYDTIGNIKRTYQYNKGEIGNSNSPVYIPNDYEEIVSFQFSNGKPIQVTQKNGVTVSYIWAFNGQLPVAKIKGRPRQGINNTTLSNLENATYFNLQTRLLALRNDPYLEGAMVTTYTYEPLCGIKTITDPKGDTITYHYDALGRLDFVTDKEGNRLSENEYNYRPQ